MQAMKSEQTTSSTSSRATYARRFKRSPNPPAFHIQPRDIEILKQIHGCRLLRADHIDILVGGGKRQLRYRLQHLFQHNYLDRMPILGDVWQLRQTNQIAYSLALKGHRLLAEHIDIPSRKLKLPRPQFIEHTLLVNDIISSMQYSCSLKKNLTFIPSEEIIASSPAGTQTSKYPLGWKVNATIKNKKKTLNVFPDYMFGVHDSSRPEGRKRTFFFLEADRGTEPVRRTSPGTQTYYAEKFHKYYQTFCDKIHKVRYNIPNFRMLTVTTKSRRVDTMLEANKAVRKGGFGGFLFTSEKIKPDDDLFSLAWTNGKGERVYLLE